MNLVALSFLLLFSNVLFAVGLFAPCMVISPGFGELSSLLVMLKPEIGASKSLSIFGGIIELFSSGSYFVGSIILLFSVVFPIWKFSVCWSSLSLVYLAKSPESYLSSIDKLGKYSMIDIFVIALLLLAIKGLPGGTSVHLSWGVLAFALSIILSLGLPSWIKKTWNKVYT